MKKESVEIEVRVPEGDGLLIPNEVFKRLNIGRGSRVHIRVTAGGLSGALKRRHVTEEEIERIAALQLEPRENVIRFLGSEACLSANRKFRNRARSMRSRF